MSVVARSAATLAYRKAVKKTRDKGNRDVPQWLNEFRDRIPEFPEGSELSDDNLKTNREEERNKCKDSDDWYERFAWVIHSRVTSTNWFESFIVANIVLIGVATGIDLQYKGEDQTVNTLVDVVGVLTMAVFSCEVILKVVAEARSPHRYFTDPENGTFNTFDFTIVLVGYAFLGSDINIGGLRMLRLVRLLTFVKGVPQLRVIVSGLVAGLRSVTYIVMLLLLIIYMCAILGCLFFGENDPARFGTVPMSMLSLFQVSTLASWSSIAYTSWWGCNNFIRDHYGEDGGADNPSKIHTSFGAFEGYKCDTDIASPATTLFFFSLYIVLTSWVIMSLFIGAITMGMFEAFEELKEEIKEKRYEERIADNNAEKHLVGENEGAMVKLIRIALSDDPVGLAKVGPWQRRFESVSEWCLKTRESTWFANLITVTILTIGVLIGVNTDTLMSCDRLEERSNGTRNHPRCETSIASSAIAIASQIIFTAEVIIKILAEKYEPYRYFRDSWNCLDLFVVITGYIEMTPAQDIFRAFPVVILRLLRLLRVFRLAKALPRLRSIVEALMQGFSAVGWILALITVFNYIMACMCMVLLRDHDPFHFGTVPRAMFSVLRIETLDTWDQILLIAMFGCDEYPYGYNFTEKPASFQCQNPRALGWIGAFFVVFMVIFGSYVLPTVLIGIVAIRFEEATIRAKTLQEMLAKMRVALVETERMMPGYFTPSRIDKIKNLFAELDADDELTLDMNEVAPFMESAFLMVFGVEITYEEMEALYHITDADASTEMTFAKFFLLIGGIKELERKFLDVPNFAARTFKFTRNKFSTPEDWKKLMTSADTRRLSIAEKLEQRHVLKKQASVSMLQKQQSIAQGSRKQLSTAAQEQKPTPRFLQQGSAEQGVGQRPRKPPRRVHPPKGTSFCQPNLAEKSGGGNGGGGMAVWQRTTAPLDDLIANSCDALSLKFLALEREGGPGVPLANNSLSENLFQAVTAELLLTSHSKAEAFGRKSGFEHGDTGEDIDRLVKRAASIAFGKQPQRPSPQASAPPSAQSSHSSAPNTSERLRNPTQATTLASVENRFEAAMNEGSRDPSGRALPLRGGEWFKDSSQPRIGERARPLGLPLGSSTARNASSSEPRGRPRPTHFQSSGSPSKGPRPRTPPRKSGASSAYRGPLSQNPESGVAAVSASMDSSLYATTTQARNGGATGLYL